MKNKLKIVLYPDPILKKPCQKIKKFDRQLRDLADNMLQIVKEEQAVGLAASQVGKSIKLIIVRDFENQKDYKLCNPEIIKGEGEQTGPESCLSAVDQWYEITRPNKVIVKYQDLTGKACTLKAEGLTARCLVHETEHTKGIFLTDSNINDGFSWTR